MTESDTKLLAMPPRPQDGHKGMFGRVLVIGGSTGMIGAPVFSGTAALRMGVGIAQIATPKSILISALTITPELIGLPLAPRRELLAAIRLADSVVVGPGLGRSSQTDTLVKQVLMFEKDIVVDADALSAFVKMKKWPAKFRARTVLTPHPGEMARMLGQARISSSEKDREKIATEFAQKLDGQVVVLKGAKTVVTDGARVYVNETGDTSLAKAGTGDVLSGMIAALLAQKMSRFESACLAVHLHGLAGEIAGTILGPRSVLAGDVLSAISSAIQKYSTGTCN